HGEPATRATLPERQLHFYLRLKSKRGPYLSLRLRSKKLSPRLNETAMSLAVTASCPPARRVAIRQRASSPTQMARLPNRRAARTPTAVVGEHCARAETRR